jgi:ABC-type bacteriocin/lantibiotic exporter with double-glycine peptidase domain
MLPLIAQRRGFDCGVACVAMLCHVDYADAFHVAALVAGRSLTRGLTLDHLQAMARRLKRPLVRVPWQMVDLDEDVGILMINWNDRPVWADGHAVVLRSGTIIDPERAYVWDSDEYMKAHDARPGTLLKERE